jgi:phage shock protein A
MSFLDKLTTFAKGSAHDLLDRAIDLNSPTMVRQYVRDLEDGINQIKTNAALSDGQLRTAIRERSELSSKIETDKATITKLLASTDPKGPQAAKDKGAVVVQNQSRLKAMDDSIAIQQQIVDKTNQTISSLETKHELMVSRVRELERLDRDTKAKESAATAITNAGKLAGVADNAGVDDLEDRMRRRNDVASAKFDSAMGDIHVDQPDSDDVNALLESLKPQEAVAAK